jgi:hypothetical protein
MNDIPTAEFGWLSGRSNYLDSQNEQENPGASSMPGLFLVSDRITYLAYSVSSIAFWGYRDK